MSAVAAVYRRLAAVADRHDSGRDSEHAGTVATAWAAGKVAATALAAPVVVPAMLAGIWRRTGEVRPLQEGFAAIVQDLLDGAGAVHAAARTGRLDAGSRWFVTSDLHRCYPGRADWPARQGTGELYRAILGHYADQRWGLVENGDVEDFWLVGGSTYGVLYDAVRTGLLLAGRLGVEGLRAVYREHLARIVANNAEVYDLIEGRFHSQGRYRRVAGNHDDVFLDPVMVGALGRHHPGIEVHDFLVMDGASGPAGLVTHGHHFDPVNLPLRNAVAIAGMSILSSWDDLRIARSPIAPPDPDETAAVGRGELAAQMLSVPSRAGIDRSIRSFDEHRLFDSARHMWGNGAGDLDTGPLVVFGHSHIPFAGPVSPVDGRRWSRYLNSGCGVFHRLVTGIEWDGTGDLQGSEARLVAWGWADEGVGGQEVVAETREGRLARTVLGRVPLARS